MFWRYSCFQKLSGSTLLLSCNNSAHPTAKCPPLKMPKPTMIVAGNGTEDTLFNQLPDSIFKANLTPKCTPTAKVTMVGAMVLAAVIESQMTRICPLSTQWKWETLPHGDDSFLVSFPSFE